MLTRGGGSGKKYQETIWTQRKYSRNPPGLRQRTQVVRLRNPPRARDRGPAGPASFPFARWKRHGLRLGASSKLALFIGEAGSPHQGLPGPALPGEPGQRSVLSRRRLSIAGAFIAGASP